MLPFINYRIVRLQNCRLNHIKVTYYKQYQHLIFHILRNPLYAFDTPPTAFSKHAEQLVKHDPHI